MELFDQISGCLTDEGLQALADGQLDELSRLEAAEHLAFCDACLDRYTALLAGPVIVQPPQDLQKPVWQRIRSQMFRVLTNRGSGCGHRLLPVGQRAVSGAGAHAGCSADPGPAASADGTDPADAGAPPGLQ